MTLHHSLVLLLLLTGACQLTPSGQSLQPTAGNSQAVDLGNDASLPPMTTPLRLRYEQGVRAVFEDTQGNLWFASHQEGVCKFDGAKLTYFTTEHGLSNNQVRSIQEDANGHIWFETGDGISSYDGLKITAHEERDYASMDSWGSAPSDLWFKEDERVGVDNPGGTPGTIRYDGDKLSFLAFPEIDGDREGFTFSVSTPVAKGKDGQVWFGTYSAVIGFDGKSHEVINNASLGLDGKTDYLHIRSLLSDSKGRLWIGNNGSGVLIRDRGTTVNFSTTYDTGLGNPRLTPQGLDRVFAIEEDLDGNIWLGTRDHGAWRFDGESLTHFSVPEGLESSHVWSFTVDKRGDVWIAGAKPSGVYRFNGEAFERAF